MGSTAQRPLMLKDYLQEDQSFDSRRGFPSAHHGCCEATMRSLLELELREARKRGEPRGLSRSRSKGAALTRISALLNAVRMLATASSAAPRVPRQGVLQKSLSRRLLAGTFWRRRCPREETKSAAGGKFLIRDVIQLESFVDEARGGRKVVSPPRPTSPLGSSRYSFSCSSRSGWSEEGSSSEPSSPSSHVPVFLADDDDDTKKRSSAVAASPTAAAAAATKADRCVEAKTKEIKEHEAGDYPRCHDYEEKEQLSPVSVMDFPYDEEEEEEEEDEEETASLSFQQSLASLERTKQELLEKIRRFESLARLVEPVDLDDALSEEDLDGDAGTDGQNELGEEEADANTRAKTLLEQLKRSCSAEALERECLEPLLLDFFLEGLREADRSGDEAALLPAARDWADGSGRKKDAASRESLMAEMEVGGRWRCVDEVDEGVAADVEAQVLASLVDELVLDLLAC